jgi:outer membrane protein, heavy metal efflux system
MVFKWSARVQLTRVGVLAVVLTAAAPIATAQSSTADPALASALREAWRRHPAADATEATLAAARARADASSQPIYNPEVEFAYGDEGDRTTTAGMSLTLDIYGKRNARTAAGAAELSLVEARAYLRRSEFTKRWLLAWAEYRTTSRRVIQGQQRLDLMQRFADLAEKQLGVGDISPLERDLSLLARDEAQAEQAALEAAAAMALESFQVVGGTPGLAMSTPSAEPPSPIIRSEGWSLATLPEAAVASAETLSAEERISVAERERRPDPTIGVHVGRIDFGPISDNVFGLTLSMPIQVRNSFRAEIVATRADADTAAAEQRLTLVELSARVDRALSTYATMHATWTRWSQSAGTDVTARAPLLERLWRAGELSTADYLIQLKQTSDTALAGTELQGRLWTSYVEALAAVGALDAWVGFDPIVSEVTP